MSKFPPQESSSSEEDNYLTAINTAYSDFIHPQLFMIHIFILLSPI